MFSEALEKYTILGDSSSGSSVKVSGVFEDEDTQLPPVFNGLNNIVEE